MLLLGVVALGGLEANAQDALDGGNFTGTDYEGYTINHFNRNENVWSKLRFQTGTRAFGFINKGDNFSLFYDGSTTNTSYGSTLFSVNKNGNMNIKGNICLPAAAVPNAVGMVWGQNYSKIMDNGNLNILTDDSFFIGKIDIDGERDIYKPYTLYANVNSGNVGIGTTTPSAKLQVTNGAIRPFEGNNDASGISFSPNIGGGGGDDAYIRYYVESGENTKLVIGTGNDVDDDIAFNQAGAERMTIYNGNVGIGTSTPAYKLSVKGAVAANDYNVVTAASMPDYVFANDYKLPSLSETEAYINANKHLPAFKSAKEMEATGYSVVDMDKGLLQTLEETILHNIAQEKEITNLKSEMAEIKALLLKK